ncbi:MAG TPA: hypothetical protein VFO89_07470, partial [Thermoanaerobaculia bacterium]|nr:hypothetical protein [Thermoanaerobaculia bacterium]
HPLNVDLTTSGAVKSPMEISGLSSIFTPARRADRVTPYNCRVAARDIRVRKTTLAEAGERDDEMTLTPGQRVEMVWQLTRDAWTFKDGRWDEPRLRRDVGRVIRRRC